MEAVRKGSLLCHFKQKRPTFLGSVFFGLENNRLFHFWDFMGNVSHLTDKSF